MSRGPLIRDEQIEEILDMLADSGISLKEACETADVSYSAVRKRIKDSETLTALHASAREDYMFSKVDLMAKVVRDEPDVARARLICDNIKWEAARILPKVYGDKIDLNHSGAVRFEKIECTIVDPQNSGS